jgi:magnesium chelatase subunit D
LAKTYLTPSTLLILLSDGRANVAMSGGDPWQEALERAGQLNCRALIVDTEEAGRPVSRISELAQILRASIIPLADIGNFDALEFK